MGYHACISLGSSILYNVSGVFWNNCACIITDRKQCFSTIVSTIATLLAIARDLITQHAISYPVIEKASVDAIGKGPVRIGNCPFLVSYY